MKTTTILTIATLSTLLFSGCNSNSNSFSTGEVTLDNGVLLGKTKNENHYEKGVKIYDADGKESGFVDLDGIVYSKYENILRLDGTTTKGGALVGDDMCGGLMLGICSNQAMTDGYLTDKCVVPVGQETSVGDGVLIPPVVIFSCGEKVGK